MNFPLQIHPLPDLKFGFFTESPTLFYPSGLKLDSIRVHYLSSIRNLVPKWCHLTQVFVLPSYSLEFEVSRASKHYTFINAMDKYYVFNALRLVSDARLLSVMAIMKLAGSERSRVSVRLLTKFPLLIKHRVSSESKPDYNSWP